MTSDMAKSQKMIVEGDRYVDRISSLPNNVIEHIMNFMPIRDAARTCVLSTRWRNAWADHPSLVLDRRFWYDIERSRRRVLDYSKIVSGILLHHVGYVRTFVLEVPYTLISMPHINIDMWLSSLCRRGLKVLTINMLASNPYRIPCSVYSSSDLIKLSLFFCIVKSGCFTHMHSLFLLKVTFDSSVVLKTPVLHTLGLQNCYGLLYFDISAPGLKSLIFIDNDVLNLTPFLTCMSMFGVYLASSKENAYFEGRKSFSFVKLLVAWPKISALAVNGFCFKYLATGSIPCKLDLLNLRYLTTLDLRLDSELMPWFLCILRSSPLLLMFKISFGVNALVGGMTDYSDESRSVLDFQMDQLDTIHMKGFTATPYELAFAKFLLQRAPVLKKMIVEEKEKLDLKEQARIFKSLLSLQHEYPKARIVFGQN